MAYKIDYSEYALKDLKAYSKADQRFMLEKIDKVLGLSPFPRGKTIKKIQGKKYDIYRLRVNASQAYRVFFGVNQQTVLIYRIVPKKDAERVIRLLS